MIMSVVNIRQMFLSELLEKTVLQQQERRQNNFLQRLNVKKYTLTLLLKQESGKLNEYMLLMNSMKKILWIGKR